MRKLRLREVKQFAQGPHIRRLSPSPDFELFLWPPRLLLSVGAEGPELSELSVWEANPMVWVGVGDSTTGALADRTLNRGR